MWSKLAYWKDYLEAKIAANSRGVSQSLVYIFVVCCYSQYCSHSNWQYPTLFQIFRNVWCWVNDTHSTGLMTTSVLIQLLWFLITKHGKATLVTFHFVFTSVQTQYISTCKAVIDWKLSGTTYDLYIIIYSCLTSNALYVYIYVYYTVFTVHALEYCFCTTSVRHPCFHI